MKAKSAIIAAVASVGIAGAASADSLYVDLTGLSTDTSFPTASAIIPGVNIGAGSTITNIEFTNIVIESFYPSWTNEFSVGVGEGVPFDFGLYWESLIPGSAAAPGVLGPITAAFSNPGLYASTEGWTSVDGILVVYLYEAFADAGAAPDATVLSGGITIYYDAIPAPGALALLGLAGMVGGRRRRA